MSMTFTTTDLNNLQEALLTGAQEVQIGDRKIRYRSQAEILQTIRMVEEYLSGSESDSSPKVIQATFNKGQS